MFVTSHGLYSTWGPCYDVLKRKGYRCLVYAVGVYRPQCIHIADTIISRISAATGWKQFGERDLTAAQQLMVERAFDERFNGKSVDTALYHRGVDRSVESMLCRPKFRTTFGLFANVVWDGDIVERNSVFAGAVEWIVATVRHLEGGPDRLILRFHPSEETMYPFSRKLESVIREQIPDLDTIPNVTVVSSHAKLDVYGLARECIDVGLVYDGMLALELVYLGIPVITPARSRYCGAGVTFEPKDRAAYFELMASALELKDKLRKGRYRENACRFAYWYLFESCYLLPLLKSSGFCEIDFTAGVEVLDPSKNKEVLRTVHAFADAAGTMSQEVGQCQHG